MWHNFGRRILVDGVVSCGNVNKTATAVNQNQKRSLAMLSQGAEVSESGLFFGMEDVVRILITCLQIWIRIGTDF